MYRQVLHNSIFVLITIVILRYQPQDIILETKLRPFIPEHVPAIGDIDAFLKVPRPDGKEDSLGLTVLDEPSSRQSDPHVLNLQMRYTSKQSMATSLPTVRRSAREIVSPILDVYRMSEMSPMPTRIPKQLKNGFIMSVNCKRLKQETPFNIESSLMILISIPIIILLF